MYVSNNIAERIKKISKEKLVTVKKVLSDAGVNYNTMSNLKASFPKADNLAKIADQLDCSVDYLLGRTENPTAHKCSAPTVALGDISNNSGVIGGIGNSAPVTINSNSTEAQVRTLLNTFNSLDPLKQAKLLVYADELSEK